MSFMVREAIETVKEEIAAAASRANREKDEILLMAVSKTKPLESAVCAAQCGVLLGENYVQEFREKVDAAPELPWHFIGHLQTNKVKYVVGRARMIHSVDSLHLAEAIDREAEKRGIRMPCLIEINSGEEKSKFGLTIPQTPYIIKEMMTFPNICLRGLMTVAPNVDDPEENRMIFRAMKEAFDEGKALCDTFDTLSMGMSGDFTVAVEEGSTLVRVGTRIFGARDYTK